jgi:L-alanine-DL-glutamate epimerase-like enolase superfamily enzyme
MQVISVEVFDLHMVEMPTWHPVIVRVSTDEGISGLGEVGLENGASHAHPARVRPAF